MSGSASRPALVYPYKSEQFPSRQDFSLTLLIVIVLVSQFAYLLVCYLVNQSVSQSVSQPASVW
jgi:hypothetical protein